MNRALSLRQTEKALGATISCTDRADFSRQILLVPSAGAVATAGWHVARARQTQGDWTQQRQEEEDEKDEEQKEHTRPVGVT